MSEEIDGLLKSDLQKLAHSQQEELEELRAKVTALEVAKPAHDSPADSVSMQEFTALMEQNRRLMSALAGEREAKERIRQVDNPFKEETYTVSNVAGTYVWVRFHDSRGNLVERNLSGRGAELELTAAQIAEVQDERPDLFEQGFLSAPEIIPDNANTIRDFDKFLNSLDLNTLRQSLAEIDSANTLSSLIDYIESKRFVHENSDGEAFIQLEPDGTKHAIMKEQELDSKLAAIKAGLIERLTQLKDLEITEG